MLLIRSEVSAGESVRWNPENPTAVNLLANEHFVDTRVRSSYQACLGITIYRSSHVAFRSKDDMRRTSTGTEAADLADPGSEPAGNRHSNGSIPGLHRGALPPLQAGGFVPTH